ncbi:MAG: phage tail protein [Nannocystaceae bacterium]
MAVEDLALGFRFGVYFFAGGLFPNRVDIRFKRVSGLGATVHTVDHREGGQNMFTRRIPDGISHDNIVFERGMVVDSLLNLEFQLALSFYTMNPSNVMVTLFDGAGAPLGGWLCVKAFPVRWTTSDLDAGSTDVVVDTFELAYQRLIYVRT